MGPIPDALCTGKDVATAASGHDPGVRGPLPGRDCANPNSLQIAAHSLRHVSHVDSVKVFDGTRCGPRPLGMPVSCDMTPRILIADDQPDLLDALRLLLKGQGIEYDTVTSPDAAVRALQSRALALVLLDLNSTADTTPGCCDAIRFSDTRLALAIADVVGKGIPAALLMSNLQAAVRAFASDSAEPQALCDQVNRILCGNIAEGRFISFFYCVLDATAGVLTYTNAGHYLPMLVRGDGRVERLDAGGPLPGGIGGAHVPRAQGIPGGRHPPRLFPARP